MQLLEETLTCHQFRLQVTGGHYQATGKDSNEITPERIGTESIWAQPSWHPALLYMMRSRRFIKSLFPDPTFIASGNSSLSVVNLFLLHSCLHTAMFPSRALNVDSLYCPANSQSLPQSPPIGGCYLLSFWCWPWPHNFFQLECVQKRQGTSSVQRPSGFSCTSFLCHDNVVS